MKVHRPSSGEGTTKQQAVLVDAVCHPLLHHHASVAPVLHFQAPHRHCRAAKGQCPSMNLSAIRVHCASPNPPTGLLPTMTPISIYQQTTTIQRHRAHLTSYFCLAHVASPLTLSRFHYLHLADVLNCLACLPIQPGYCHCHCRSTPDLFENTRRLNLTIWGKLHFGTSPSTSAQP